MSDETTTPWADSDWTEMMIFEVGVDTDADAESRKCDSCRYTCSHRFVMAGSKEYAEKMVSGETGDGPYNGFCGDCMIGIIRGGTAPMEMGQPDTGHTILEPPYR